jgi:FKBP-type peptidyl-prolyl cis-trans isomerase SlyD
MEDDMGNRHIGKIIRVMKESITMDFNHPLAGKDIIFTGKVLSVRKADGNDLATIVT